MMGMANDSRPKRGAVVLSSTFVVSAVGVLVAVVLHHSESRSTGAGESTRKGPPGNVIAVRPRSAIESNTAVIEDGDAVVAQGRLFRQGGKFVLCSPEGAGMPSDPGSSPTVCKAGVPLDVPAARARPYVGIGSGVRVEGFYRAGVVRVTRLLEPAYRRTDPLVAPPSCTDHGMASPEINDGAAERYAGDPSHAVVRIGIARNRIGRYVLLVAAPGDAAVQARTALAHRYAGLLCVVTTPFDSADMARTRADVRSLVSSASLTRPYDLGDGFGHGGLPKLEIDVAIYTPSLQVLLRNVPANEIKIESWMSVRTR